MKPSILSSDPCHYDHELVAAHALLRIANTLDDYMDLTLAGQSVAQATAAMAGDSGAAEFLKPLIDELKRIRTNRETREY